MSIRKILSFLIFTLTTVLLGAQNDQKETHKLIEKAQEKIYNEAFQEAYNIYDDLSKRHPEDETYFNFKKGSALVLMSKNSNLALKYIKKAHDEAYGDGPTHDVFQYMHPEINYYLGRAYHMNSKFDSAIYYYNQSLTEKGGASSEIQEEIEYRKEQAENAKKIISEVTDHKVKNIGTGVNTSFDDYKPVISSDESVLIFTSRNDKSTGQLIDIDGKYFEDIYVSQRNNLGYWINSTGISPNINTNDHEASIGLSADGRHLLVYKGDENSGNIMLSKKEGEQWSVPESIDDNKTINTKKSYETSACLTLDENTIYFSSQRKNGFGGLDLYKSDKNSDGEWTTPVNLGGLINTEYDEESPFIHPDGKTLYFSSRGHNNMGGFDIFKSLLVNGKWTEPVNIGYPINSVYNDVHFVLTADGKKGYFSSGRDGGSGGEDIYRVKLNEKVKPLVLVKGIVNADKEALADVNIDIYDGATMKKQDYIYKPDNVTGKYLMILPPGKSYKMLVSAIGYETYELTLDIPNLVEFHEFYQEITLRKIGQESDSTFAKEITVVNSFEDLRNNDSFDPSFNQPDPDYLKELIEDIVLLEDSNISPGSEADNLLKKKLTQVNDITNDVSDNFNRVVDNDAFSDAYTYRSNYARDAKMKSLVLNDDTINFIPFEEFTDTDLKDQDLVADNKDVNSTLDSEKNGNTNQNSTTETTKETTTKVEDSPPYNGAELKNAMVYFDFNKSEVKNSYKKGLDPIIKGYKKDNSVKLKVEAHTDSKGNSTYNRQLSERRANSVVRYLNSQGVSKNRIEVKYYGEDRPAAPNTKPDGSDNVEGRSLNRRAEIKMFR